MKADSFVTPIRVETSIRTLITGGFQISDARRQPLHIEILCSRNDLFDEEIQYLIAIFDKDDPPLHNIENVRASAKRLSRNPIFVSPSGTSNCLPWHDFVNLLGGAVPSWRALGSEYVDVITQSGRMEVPFGLTGEAWQIYEDAVGDGFEFLLGHRVLRLGGKRRGQRVSDMLALTPGYRVLVIDAKASKGSFDLNWTSLRPLIEYTKVQLNRQRAEFPVGVALLVANDFSQGEKSLMSLSQDFLAETRVPLGFLSTSVLTSSVNLFVSEPRLRAAVRWEHIFCRSGLIALSIFQHELANARSQQYSRTEITGRT